MSAADLAAGAAVTSCLAEISDPGLSRDFVSDVPGTSGTILEVKVPALGEGIWMLTSWLTGLGSWSRTIGRNTATMVTKAIAPIRRRRARFLSCSSSSLIDFAVTNFGSQRTRVS